MVVTKISVDYRLAIPDTFRELFSAGQEVAIRADQQGRLVITPIEQIRATLLETFGMWADRDDIPDSVDYVNEIRHGQRLAQLGLHRDETH